MFYSSIIGLSLVLGVLSQGSVRFSELNNFDSQCNSDTEINSLAVTDLYSSEEMIGYCFDLDSAPNGQFYTRFYDSNGNMVFQHGTFTGVTYKSYSIPVYYFAQDSDSSRDIFTLKIETESGIVVISADINISGIGPSIHSIAARNGSPTEFDEYFPTADGSIGDGEILYFDSPSDKIYFLGVYYSINANQETKIIVEYNSGDKQEFGPYFWSEDGQQRAWGSGTSVGNFPMNSDIKITIVLYNIDVTIDEKTITIQWRLNEGDTTTDSPVIQTTVAASQTTLSPETTQEISETDAPETTLVNSEVSSIGVRTVAPNDLSDYYGTAEGSISDGEMLIVDNLSSDVYFCSVYSSLNLGSNVQIVVSERESSVKSVSQFYNSYGFCYIISLNSFSNDESISITSSIYDSLMNVIDSKSITITYDIVSDTTTSLPTNDYYCEEKPNRRNWRCEIQTVESECKRRSACQWVCDNC